MSSQSNEFDIFDQIETLQASLNNQERTISPPSSPSNVSVSSRASSSSDTISDRGSPTKDYGTSETSSIVSTRGECLHHNVGGDFGITECLDCGERIKTSITLESKMYIATDKRSMGDGNRCWATKKKTRGIRDDLKGLGYSDSIINAADSLFKIVTRGDIFRVDKRNSIIVSCVLEAHKMLGIRMSLETILKQIPVTNITVGMKAVETRIKSYDVDRTRVTYSSPIDSIRDILSKWESDEKTIDEVIELFEKIDDKSSLINRSRAKSVAAGVIYYYSLSTHRKNITLKDFSVTVGLSPATITKLSREISAIMKTPQIMAY